MLLVQFIPSLLVLPPKRLRQVQASSILNLAFATTLPSKRSILRHTTTIKTHHSQYPSDLHISPRPIPQTLEFAPSLQPSRGDVRQSQRQRRKATKRQRIPSRTSRRQRGPSIHHRTESRSIKSKEMWRHSVL